MTLRDLSVIASILVCLGAMGCDDEPEPAEPPVEEPEPDTTPEPEPAEEPAAEAAPSEPGSETGAEAAIAAYVALREAFREGDAERYFAGYADTVACFHGDADVQRSTIQEQRAEQVQGNQDAERPTRIESIGIHVASATESEVELIDHGWTGSWGVSGDTVFHAKRVVLRRVEEEWRVVVEAPAEGDACGRGSVEHEAPALWTYLRDETADIVAECENPTDIPAEDIPGIGGSIGCMPSTNFQDAPTYCEENAGEETAEECAARVGPLMRVFYGGDDPTP